MTVTDLRTARIRRIMVVAGIAATAVAFSACQAPRPQATTPGPSTSAASTPPGPTARPADDGATVVGTLDVLIALTTPDSVIPEPPISYALAVRSAAELASTMHPVASDGTFALALPPGRYEVTFLEMTAEDLGTEPMVLPLSGSKTIAWTVPASGCVYGGKVSVVYGRLPAGTQKQQAAVVERGARNNNENYSFVYRPDGGFVLAGASVSLPPAGQRPDAARDCAAERFSLVNPRS